MKGHPLLHNLPTPVESEVGLSDKWRTVLSIAVAELLVLGPVFGIWAMRTLQRSTDAVKLAGGRG